MFCTRLEWIWWGLRRRLSGGLIIIVVLQQELTLIFIVSLQQNNINSGIALNGCCMTSDDSYEWLLSGFIFSCFSVNIMKPDVIIHLAVLLVNSLLNHKPVRQHITHWIICEDFLAHLLAFDFPGCHNRIRMIHIVPGPVLFPYCTHSCRLVGCTSLVAQCDSYVFPENSQTTLLLLALVFPARKYKSGTNFAVVWETSTVVWKPAALAWRHLVTFVSHGLVSFTY